MLPVGVYLLNVFTTKPSSCTFLLNTRKETSSLNFPRLLVLRHTVCRRIHVGMEQTVEQLVSLYATYHESRVNHDMTGQFVLVFSTVRCSVGAWYCLMDMYTV